VSLREPRVLWFRAVTQHHAFEVRPDGTVEEEACCGLSLDECADEPARSMEAFDLAPAHAVCLAVVELQPVRS